MKNSIGILPNEELLNVGYYYKILEINECHGKVIKDFSDRYNLGITPESMGLPYGIYSGDRYQRAMASLGHGVLCFDEEIWVYLPEFLSKGQKEWFENKKRFFKKYGKVLYYAIVADNQEIIDYRDYISKGNHFKAMYDYVESALDFQLGGKR